MDFTDLNITQGEDNMPGVPVVAWALSFDEVFYIPPYKPNPLNFADYSILDGDVVPMPYKTFYKIYATSNTGKIDDNKIEGNTGSYESIYEFFFPKNDANALGFMRLSGSKFVFIVQESDGNLRIMGISPGKPAVIKSVAGSSGTLSSGDKGAIFQVRSVQNGPAPIYNGLFNLDRDSEDLSLYPMIYTSFIVSQANSKGLPLVTDYYHLDKKIFTWYYSYNSNNQLTERHIQIHVN